MTVSRSGFEPLGGSGTGGDISGVLAGGEGEGILIWRAKAAAAPAAKFQCFGEAQSKQGRVKQGAAECGRCADNGALWQQVDEQASSDGNGHGLDGFAAGKGFQVSELTTQRKAGGGGASGSIHVFQCDAGRGVKSMG